MPPLALSSLLLLVTTMLVAVANRGTLAMPVELATKEAETPHKTRAQASVESGNQNIIGHLEERQSQQQQHKHYFSHNHNQHQRPMPQANSPYWPQVPVAMEDNSILPERTTLTADHRPITMTQPLTAPPQPHQNRQHDLNDHDLKPHQPNDYFRTTSLMHNSHLAHHRAGEPTNQQTGPPNSSFSAPLPSSSSANNNKTNDIPPPNTPSSNNHSHYNKQQQLQLQTHPEQTNPDNNNNNTTNQSTPFVFYDTPYNRRQLAKYILMEFHESDLNSVLENTPAILEAGRREVFGQVASEALIEAGSSAASGNLTGATLINGSSSPIGPGAVSNQHRPFYGEVFESFHTVYWPIHCVMCLVICTLGIPANLINVIVLTRQNMISAVNTILCAIACSDLIVNIAYIPYLIHELADSSNESAYYSYNWACYILIHAHATVTAHTISIWLTCALATWRYCVIRSQSSNKRNWSVELAKRAIAGVACFVPVFCIPNYLSFAIVHETTDKNTTIYKVGFSELSENSQFIKTSHFWIFSCLTKLLPCLLLTFFTTVLIKLMSEARKRRLRLTNNFTRNSSDNATMLHSKSSIPNGLKIGHHQRKASMDPRELDTQRRASEADPNGHHAHGVHGARGGKIAANGFRLRPGLLKRPRQDNRRTASKDDADGDDDRCGGSERVTSRSGRVAVGENNNLQLLARNMSMQRNVMVIKEAAGKCQPHQNDDDGDDGKGKKSRQTGGGHYHHQHRYQRQQTGHRFGELESSSGPFNNRLTSSMGSHEIIDFSTSANNELTDNATSGNNKSNNPASYVTPHSGSSCATDAECLHGSASSSSSDTSTDALDHQTVVQTNFQHYPHQQQQQQHPQQLLVETTAPKSMQAVSTTTRTLMMTSDDRANLIGDSSNNNNEEPPQRHPSSGMPPRSASTSGALELYAVNNNNGTGGAQSRLTMIAQNDRYAPTTTATGAPPTLGVVPRLSPGNGIRKSGMTSAHRSASASVQTNLLPENKHTSLMSTEAGDHTNSNDATRAAETATAADTIVTQDQTQTRPRSIGSASLAPLQIVRFQATHRQLSQNETTTRLLIAVIILFLVCEFPAGILAALCAILGQDFFDNVYQPMGTLTDLLALINSSVNFILYCFMSTQFRVTFYRVVLRCPSPRDVSSLK